jgi:hypothetical protein
MQQLIRTLEADRIDASPRKRTVTSIWSTDECDHFRSCFVQSGIDLSVFKENPVCQWEHGKDPQRGSLPIANCVGLELGRFRGKNALIGKAAFWDDAFSEARFQDYASGRLRGWSINVLAKDQSPPTPEERRARADWKNCDVVFRSSTLIEVSATSIPGNSSALTLSVERSGRGVPAVVTPEQVRHLLARRQAVIRDILPRIPQMIREALSKAPSKSDLSPLQALADKASQMTSAEATDAYKEIVAAMGGKDAPVGDNSSDRYREPEPYSQPASRPRAKGLPLVENLTRQQVMDEMAQLDLWLQLDHRRRQVANRQKHNASSRQ